MVNGDLEGLLPEIVDALYREAEESAGGEDAVLYEYLNDLENDVDGVRAASAIILWSWQRPASRRSASR